MICQPLPYLRPRHEAFAQGVAAGLSASRAYAQAYGRTLGTSTRACGARLLTSVSIQQRIDELRAVVEARAALSRLIPDLEARILRELATGSPDRALAMTERLARLSEQQVHIQSSERQGESDYPWSR